jgi:hypothetical protein
LRSARGAGVEAVDELSVLEVLLSVAGACIELSVEVDELDGVAAVVSAGATELFMPLVVAGARLVSVGPVVSVDVELDCAQAAPTIATSAADAAVAANFF